MKRPPATFWALGSGGGHTASRVTKHKQAYGMRVKEDWTPGGAVTSGCPLSAAPPCPWASFSFRNDSGSVTGEGGPWPVAGGQR